MVSSSLADNGIIINFTPFPVVVVCMKSTSHCHLVFPPRSLCIAFMAALAMEHIRYRHHHDSRQRKVENIFVILCSVGRRRTEKNIFLIVKKFFRFSPTTTLCFSSVVIKFPSSINHSSGASLKRTIRPRSQAEWQTKAGNVQIFVTNNKKIFLAPTTDVDRRRELNLIFERGRMSF